jgi:cyclopropane fatty-acyl-phospholipid synthase-like methyltransferase
MSNINDSYFDGQYKDIWKALIPAELTTKETEFMFSYFQLKQGQHVLDLMCGYGRHALALAEKGINITAVDNLAAYINEIKKTVAEKSLPVTAVQADVATYKADRVYDLVICMGNSLNFFNGEDTVNILAAAAESLKPGGALLINSWSLAEIAIGQFKEKAWSRIGESKFITESRYLFHPTRIETESTILTNGSVEEVKQAVDYIYSVAEMEAMLKEAGMQLKEIYSIPGRKKFAVGDPRAYIIAEKSS